jgi:hypothetical protein
MEETDNDLPNGFRVEFTKLESFCYFWNHLWTNDWIRKPKLQILDTILFTSGKPSCWLFTSQQTGEVMKKKSDRLESKKGIVESFKKKSQAFRGYKSVELRSKTAIVWFVRSDNSFCSFLVDEKELGSILHSELKEIVAIQVFMGGFVFKGNGVFYHKVTRLSSGVLSHQSYELIDSLTESVNSQFTNKTHKKLIVLESQSETLRNLGSYLSRYIEMTSPKGSEVEYLSFLVSFNSTWDPFLVGVRDLGLGKMPSSFFQRSEQNIFLNGVPPTIPLPNDPNNDRVLHRSFSSSSPVVVVPLGREQPQQQQQQITFPNNSNNPRHSIRIGSAHSHSSHSSDHHHRQPRKTVVRLSSTSQGDDSLSSSIVGDKNSHNTDLHHYSQHHHPLSVVPEDEIILQPALVTLKGEVNQVLAIPPPDLSQKPSYFKAGNEDYSLRRSSLVDQPPAFDDKKDPFLVTRPDLTSHGQGHGHHHHNNNKYNHNSLSNPSPISDHPHHHDRQINGSITEKQVKFSSKKKTGKKEREGIIPEEREETTEDQNSFSSQENNNNSQRPPLYRATVPKMMEELMTRTEPVSATTRPKTASSVRMDRGGRIRPLSANSSTKGAKNLLQQAQENRSHHYQTVTDGYHQRTTFIGGGIDTNNSSRPLSPTNNNNNINTNNRKDNNQVLSTTTRRPISAPHIADKRTRTKLYNATSNDDYEYNPNNRLDNSSLQTNDHYHDQYQDHDDQHHHSPPLSPSQAINRTATYDTIDTLNSIPGAAFWRPLPALSMSGGHGGACYGDFCWFQEQVSRFLYCFLFFEIISPSLSLSLISSVDNIPRNRLIIIMW